MQRATAYLSGDIRKAARHIQDTQPHTRRADQHRPALLAAAAIQGADQLMY